MGAFRIAKEELWITNHVLVNPCLRVHFKPKTVARKCSSIHSCSYEPYFGAYHGRYLQYFAVKPLQELHTSFPPHSFTVVWNEKPLHPIIMLCEWGVQLAKSRGSWNFGGKNFRTRSAPVRRWVLKICSFDQSLAANSQRSCLIVARCEKKQANETVFESDGGLI